MNNIILYIAGAIIILGGIFYFINGSKPIETPVIVNTEEISPLSKYFGEQMIALGIADIGNPREGFDPQSLIMAFPGLTSADFEAVEALEGQYKVVGGEVTFVRAAAEPVTSAEATVTPIGFDTLFKNLSARLAFAATDNAAIDELIKKVDTSEHVYVALGLSVSALGVTITPMELLEDSRCPSDVQCIQAGTVRIKATIVSGMGTSTSQIFKLMEPVTTEAEVITLTQVAPNPISTEKPDRADYMFQFEVKKR